MPQSGVTSEHVTKYTVLPDRAHVIYQLEATGKTEFHGHSNPYINLLAL